MVTMFTGRLGDVTPRAKSRAVWEASGWPVKMAVILRLSPRIKLRNKNRCDRPGAGVR